MEPTEEDQYPPEEFIPFQDGPTFADVAHYSDEELLFWYDGVQGEECENILDLVGNLLYGIGLDFATAGQALYDVLYRIVKLTEGEESAQDFLQHIEMSGGYKEAVTEMALATAARKVAENDLRLYAEDPCQLKDKDAPGFQARVLAYKDKDVPGFQERVLAYFATVDRCNKARVRIKPGPKDYSKEKKEAPVLFDAIVKEYESLDSPIKRSRVIAEMERRLKGEDDRGPSRNTIKTWLKDHRPDIK